MKFCIEEAFGFIKNDVNWVKKIAIGSGLAIIALLLFFVPPICAIVTKSFDVYAGLTMFICWVIALLLGLCISGFCLKTGQMFIIKKDSGLPEWDNYSEFMFIGLKSAIGSVLYYIPVILVGLAASALEFMAKSAGEAHAANETTLRLASILFNNVYNLLYIVFMAFFFLFTINFLKDFNPFSYVNVSKAIKLLKGNYLNYFILVLILLAVNVVLNIASIVLVLTIVGTFVLPFASIYIQIVSMNLIAQYANIADEQKVVE